MPFTGKIPVAADMPLPAGLEQIIEYVREPPFLPEDDIALFKKPENFR